MLNQCIVSHWENSQILDQFALNEEVRDICKDMERVSHPLKHGEGLESLRVLYQDGVIAIATFSNIWPLLLEIVETRKLKQKDLPVQQGLKLLA